MICKNLKELEKELYKRINTALDTEVADTVKEVMTDHIIQDVYDKYEPKLYQRRYNDGGLLDPENIIATLGDDGELLVQNITLGADTVYGQDPSGFGYYNSRNANEFITPIIETGIGYDVSKWKYNGVPRPFMENTHNDLEQNHYHTEALKRSLKKQGLEVK